ncbi:MAG: ATP-binding cassette domain-containing protein [Accumulibacter sp.]|jgi:branched-chain amino acid transport system ATP-binding protein
MAPLLSVRNLSTGYGKKQVLFDVSLDVMPGELLLITGGNGSGKSTLLKAIYGLLPPWNSDAEITFRPDPEGQPISTRQPTLNLKNGLAYLPQRNAVFDDLAVEDNLHLAGHTLRDANEFATRRIAVLELLPTIQSLLRRKPETMSGGERQITALAMVLLHQPKLLMLDESLSGLDSDNAGLILSLLKTLHVRSGLALLLVEHRQTAMQGFASTEFHMRLGRLAARIIVDPVQELSSL